MRNVPPLTIDEICKHLNIDRDIFYKFIEIKEFSDYHLDRLQKFKKEDIDEQLIKSEGIDYERERYSIF